MHSSETLPILVVEDSDEDFHMLEVSFKRFGVTNEVLRCEQGESVLPLLEDLKGQGRTPGLVLLDLNLIGIDGREVLKLMKGTPAFKRIPVVVLSTSASPKDVDFCYGEGASSYSVKPVDFEKFEAFVGLIKSYWLESAILPSPVGRYTGATDLV